MLPKVEILQGRTNKFLLLQTDDHISTSIRENGDWARFESHLCLEVCAKLDGFSVLDVGANLGAFTLPVATAIGSSGTVHAFEAQRVIFQQLNGNIFLNQLDNVHTYFGAVADECGSLLAPSLDFEESKNIGGFSFNDEVRRNIDEEAGQGITFENRYTGKMEVIPRIRIDDIGISNVSFVKIDVEGMELEVIKGMCETLSKNRYPPILFEVWVEKPWYKARAQKLINLVRSLGYKIWASDRTHIAQHPDFPVRIEV